jgi:hypothetical protein
MTPNGEKPAAELIGEPASESEQLGGSLGETSNPGQIRDQDALLASDLHGMTLSFAEIPRNYFGALYVDVSRSALIATGDAVTQEGSGARLCGHSRRAAGRPSASRC